jgi:hypothetical protein
MRPRTVRTVVRLYVSSYTTPHSPPANVAKCNEMQEFVRKAVIQDELQYKYKKKNGLLDSNPRCALR